jgi:predicted RNA binding protein YcfA (HicA-like mRNA interferase family)
MPKLAPIHWRELEKFLLSVGCTLVRETRHRVYHRPGLKRPVIVPKYNQIPVFVIRNNLRVLGISVEEYLRILEEL